MANPFDAFDPVPVPILGAPKPVDPYKEEDQQLQRDAADRAERAADRADKTAQRQAAAAELSAKAATKPTEFQAKSAGFLGRMMEAEKAFSAVPESDRGARSLPRQTLHNMLPGVENTFVNSADRQKADQAQENFIAASLRQESGAAISPQEFTRQYNIFFPAPGDSAETLAQKADARRQAIEGFKIAAGPLAEQAAGTTQTPLPDAAVQSELQARIARGDDPKATIAWLIAAGHPPTDEQAKAIMLNAGNPHPDVRPPDNSGGGGVWGQLGQATGNVVSGIAQGVAALPDMAANAVGATLALPAQAMGFDHAADVLRRPFTIGGAIEQANPTPQDVGGKTARIGAQFLGGAIGFPQSAAQAITNRIVPNAPAVIPNALAGGSAPIMGAAQRQGVELLPADVGGDFVKGMTSAAAQAPLSRGSIMGVSRRAATQMGNAARRTANGVGEALPPDEAGAALRRGGEQVVAKQTDRASRFYERAGEQAKGVTVIPDEAIKVIDEQIARKSQAGEMSGDIVGELQKVRRSLAQPGGMTVEGLRQARTILGALARNDKLRGTDAQRIFGNALNAASEDMSRALSEAGKPGTARLFRRADALWKERIMNIDEVWQPIIGKAKSGEDIVNSIEAMARGSRGGAMRLQRVMAEMPESEKGDFVATAIDRLGKASAGAQDDTGSVFSSETFLTNWNKMSSKGKAALFGNSETRRNLDDIAMIAAGRRGTAAIASKSNTPIGLTGNVGALGAAGAITSPATAVVLGGLQYATGKLLAAPAFTKWLARTPRSAAGIGPHIARLSTIASQNPAIADDIARFQRMISGVANENVGVAGRAAASGDGTDPNRR
jgi:hypothetical protein